ncbi:MAG: hypothetical protein ACOYOK_15615, partial [Pseudobdellovibrionaceae bacterium]
FFMLCAVCLQSTSALAGPWTYRPFLFDDKNLNTRADIKDTIPRLVLKTNSEHAPSFSDLYAKDAQLSFFTEITDLLLLQKNPRQKISIAKEKSIFVSKWQTCQNQIFALRKQILAQNLVGNDKKDLLNLSKITEKICESIYKPDNYIAQNKSGDVSFFKVSHMISLFETLSEPIVHLPEVPIAVPESFFDTYYGIVLKMRILDLNKSVSQLAGLSSTLQKQIQKNNSYVTVAGYKTLANAVIQQAQNQIKQASQFAKDIFHQGQKEYKTDQNKFKNARNYRPELPYPFLSDKEREFISLYLGALAWRARGGGLLDEPQGTQKTRFYFNFIPMSIIGNLNGGDKGRSIAQAIFYRLFKGWGKFMDMGHTPGQSDKYHDLVMMTNRGLYQIVSTETLLINDGYDSSYLRAGGLQMGPCYYYSWDQLPLTVAPDLQPPYADVIDGPTAWGELCVGATISLGLSKSLLGGHRK